MTEKEYRSYPAISRSELFRLSAGTPEKFKFEKENPAAPTPSLIFGQALHKMVLQSDSFFDDFAVAPNIDRRTKAGKEQYAEFVQSLNDKTELSAETYEVIVQMTEKLNNEPFVKKLLGGEHETPYFWTDEMTGEKCKCRIDAYTEIGGKPYIIDLKTTTNAENGAFTRDAIKYGYPLQAAMYREGVLQVTGKKCGFIFIAIEKDPPYSINIFEVDDAFITYGYDVFRELIGIYHDCKMSENWYGYLGKFNNINRLNLPAYLAKEVM